MNQDQQLSNLEKLAEEMLRLQTQYTMQPNIGRMNAARTAKDSFFADLRAALTATQQAAPSQGAMRIGGKYNWKGQPERLIFLGRNWSGNGLWNQFALVESPTIVWCEVLDADLSKLEETAALPEASAQREQPAYRGPTLTPEEVADGNRGIRWVTDTAVFGRPTECDVREYLQKRGDDAKCHCAKCAAFYSQPAASNPEPQAQAGELEIVAWIAQYKDALGRPQKLFLPERPVEGSDLLKHGAKVSPLITLQSHRKAIAKKDAALKAYEKAAECSKSALSEAIMIAPLTHVPPSAGAAIQELDAAITQGQEALK